MKQAKPKFQAHYILVDELEKKDYTNYYHSKYGMIEDMLEFCIIDDDEMIQEITEECLTHLKYEGEYIIELESGSLWRRRVLIKVIE